MRHTQIPCDIDQEVQSLRFEGYSGAGLEIMLSDMALNGVLN